jgi:hypothetical protein
MKKQKVKISSSVIGGDLMTLNENSRPCFSSVSPGVRNLFTKRCS